MSEKARGMRSKALGASTVKGQRRKEAEQKEAGQRTGGPKLVVEVGTDGLDLGHLTP